MGCQSTHCKQCKGSFPACQLKDGLCYACRNTQPKPDVQASPPVVIDPNHPRTY